MAYSALPVPYNLHVQGSIYYSTLLKSSHELIICYADRYIKK